MFTWLAENLVTIILGLLVLAVFAAIILNWLKNRKSGKSSCGCSCAGCAMSGQCHRPNS